MLNKALLLATGKKADPFTTGKFTIINGYAEALIPDRVGEGFIGKPFYGYNRYEGTFGYSQTGQFPIIGECNPLPKFLGREVVGFFWVPATVFGDETLLMDAHVILGSSKSGDVEWTEEEWDMVSMGSTTLINHTTGDTFALGFGMHPYSVAGMVGLDGEPNDSYFQEGESQVWEICFEPYEE